LRFTLRLFRKSVGFSLVAILSLALGIGASSAIFSLVYAVLVDPYPYKNSDRIVAPMFSDTRGEQGRIWYAIPDYLDLKRNSSTIEDAFLADGRTIVATGGLAEPVRAIAYSSNAFEFLGVPAMLGRNFGPNDIPSAQTPPNIAVLSYLFWQRHFNGDPNIVGKTLELNHQPYSILGVAPPRFTWSDGDVYIPLPLAPGSRKPIPLTARIKPGVGLDACSAELQAMTERFAKQSPGVYPKEFRLSAKPLKESRLGKFRGTLLILMAAVGFLLLIACGNVSILLLARASARQKEMALRLALGASRRRVIQQLLTESVLLALAGGLIGVFLAYRGVPAIVTLMPEYAVPHEAAIQVNGAVVLFSFAISVLTGILFGMAPALQLAKHDVRDAMQESGRGFAGSVKTGKVRSVLIVGEVALTVILLTGAGIAVRGFVALTQARLGYDPSNVLMMYLSTREGDYKTWEARRIHFERILDKLQSTPGVQGATAAISALPPRISWDTQFEIAGQQKDPNQRILIGLVAGDYFSTVRIPVLRGRIFSRAELQRPERVVVINEEMQRHYWPDGRDPIGLKILVPELKLQGSAYFFTPPAPDQWLRIIGVVATARNRGLQDPPKPAIYLPYTLVLGPDSWFLVRTDGDPHRFVNALREQIRSVDADTPVSRTMTLTEFLSRSERAYPRFSTTLFSIFASVGLILAATGLYSVVSFVVTRRTHEFGIRMALGARATDVLYLVMGMTARLMFAGIAIGLAGSVALSRVIANYIQGWDPKDPIAFLAVTAVLLAVALVACWFPTRRATAIQPMSALRHE
jgi:predicted permease